MMTYRLCVASRPLHGLGNRVRLVLSGASLARFTQRAFDYYWPVNRHFGAAMTDLWQYQPSLSTAEELILRLRAPLMPAAELANPTAAARRIWHVRSGSTLPLPSGAEDWHRLLAQLRLTESLAGRVRKIHGKAFGHRPYIGVMVRAHPNAHSLTKAHSPLVWYASRMRELQSTLGDVGFYVSSDTPAAAQTLQESFPTAFSIEKTGEYNTRQALQDSVMDLYLLASSAHILGPHHSSFPELAHFLTLGQVPLETSVGESYARVRPPVTLTVAPDPVSPRVRVHA